MKFTIYRFAYFLPPAGGFPGGQVPTIRFLHPESRGSARHLEVLSIYGAKCLSINFCPKDTPFFSQDVMYQSAPWWQKTRYFNEISRFKNFFETQNTPYADAYYAEISSNGRTENSKENLYFLRCAKTGATYISCLIDSCEMSQKKELFCQGEATCRPHRMKQNNRVWWRFH